MNMKKLFLLSALVLMNVATFAGSNTITPAQCNAHYYLHVFDGGKEYVIASHYNGSGSCAEAMAEAKEQAWDMYDFYF